MSTPTPKPTPRPSSLPRPQAAQVVNASHIDHDAEVARAVSHGRADADGNVFVTTPAGERAVGQYPDATPDEALEYFAKKYVELAENAVLLRNRLSAGAPGREVVSAAKALQESLPEANVVGDLKGLSATLDTLISDAEATESRQAARAQAAKLAAAEDREALVVEAETLAKQDPSKIQWKHSGARLRELFAQWKDMQRSGPRLPRAVDQELWGRFSQARNTFEHKRKEFFAELDKVNAEGKRIKEKIVAEAESLSASTDFRTVSQKYKDLMSQWKRAPRASRKDDDALWARFRAAQDVFFSARDAENAALDEEFKSNLVVKEELLKKAQALLPITDPMAAKRELRTIQDQWEDAGKVPRADVSRMENGLRDVERALADAEEAAWQRSNPETKARTSGALSQLDESIVDLEKKLETAKSGGDEKAVAEAQEALDARRAWRDQLAQTAAELD
ncbi:DUF349 domain-containing protein [Brevibacterium linens]|uniref:DUF349 domain-containing protein n=2 Tax=Brevibacterium linens TaxID=1703 RepID=A0A2H1HL69_BRELN|nr:DUF349 domain-containing protein [Brevibacterium linens]KAB1949546.1 DUF349 domain-containing protein [Brevibacterium linens ATCC 9172]SMX63223.1 protein of unknown function (DUF349) [Brevibacterium linens ATCC 9172]SMX63634.1 protein of unknown function (DUF349) [Brevibacterium linens]